MKLEVFVWYAWQAAVPCGFCCSSVLLGSVLLILSVSVLDQGVPLPSPDIIRNTCYHAYQHTAICLNPEI